MSGCSSFLPLRMPSCLVFILRGHWAFILNIWESRWVDGVSVCMHPRILASATKRSPPLFRRSSLDLSVPFLKSTKIELSLQNNGMSISDPDSFFSSTVMLKLHIALKYMKSFLSATETATEGKTHLEKKLEGKTFLGYNMLALFMYRCTTNGLAVFT